MIPDRMQENSAHCGPVAIAGALQIKPAQVMADWPDRWIDHRTDRKWWLWPIDTPWNHRKYLNKLGRQMIEISDNNYPVNAIVLIHNVNAGRNPITQFICGLIYQHWVRVLLSDDQQVVVDYGTDDQPVKTYDKASFDRLVNGAWPRCVYQIGGKT